jgi:hypothetical protein
MFDEKWEPAEGILIGTRYGGKHGDRSGNASVTANSARYLMEVRPLSGAEPFRCECEPPSLMSSFKSPPMNVPVKMQCIPVRKKARFDRTDPAISQTATDKTGTDKTGTDKTGTEQHARSVYRVELRAGVSHLDRRSLNGGEKSF